MDVPTLLRVFVLTATLISADSLRSASEGSNRLHNRAAYAVEQFGAIVEGIVLAKEVTQVPSPKGCLFVTHLVVEPSIAIKGVFSGERLSVLTTSLDPEAIAELATTFPHAGCVYVEVNPPDAPPPPVGAEGLFFLEKHLGVAGVLLLQHVKTSFVASNEDQRLRGEHAYHELKDALLEQARSQDFGRRVAEAAMFIQVGAVERVAGPDPSMVYYQFEVLTDYRHSEGLVHVTVYVPISHRPEDSARVRRLNERFRTQLANFPGALGARRLFLSDAVPNETGLLAAEHVALFQLNANGEVVTETLIEADGEFKRQVIKVPEGEQQDE